MRPRSVRARTVLAASAALLLTGCGGTTDAHSPGGSTLTVLAAASLTDTFTELEAVFEAQHDGVDVQLAFDSSATLAGQVAAGAPADVLATADARTMESVVDAGASSTPPEVFATNTMVLVVPAGNPAGIESFADLDRPDVSYVTCVESAPCGALAQSLLEINDVAAAPRSYEVDVRAVLTKVELDEADAGLVYASDAASAGDMVRTLEIPSSSEGLNSYLATTLEQAELPGPAREWIELLSSAEGRRVLTENGFGLP